MKSALILLAAAAALTGAAHAQPPHTEITVTPEQLTSPAGQAALRERIVEAAQEVCQVTDPRALELRAERRACIEEAIAEAESQLRDKVAQASADRFAQAVQARQAADG